jgi:hypothetical protein
MPVQWTYAEDVLRLGGHGDRRIASEDAARQEQTVRAILADLRDQPGVVLADEVGMGKTYVALGVIASVLPHVRDEHRPIVVMVPPGLVTKWDREWDQFRTLCCEDSRALAWVRTRRANTAAEFFRLLDDAPSVRPHVIWMPTGAFSAGLNDPWMKLALVRLARSRTKLGEGTRAALFKWATSLVRLRSYGDLGALMERLLGEDISRWKDTLIAAKILEEGAEDPVPRALLDHADELNWERMTTLLRDGTIPGSRGAVSNQRVKEARSEFNEECQNLYWAWLRTVKWRAPLLVLDEAHHAKNDSTRLASLFRSADTEALVADAPGTTRPVLWGKFDRQLFLTATPFQLGHHELIRVLRSFASASWAGPGAPRKSRETFCTAMKELEQRLDRHRIAGRALDAAWGRVQRDRLPAGVDDARAAEEWWASACRDPRDEVEREVVRAAAEYRATKATAERDDEEPWHGLRSWVIRHNRPHTLPGRSGVARRLVRAGRAIEIELATTSERVEGLSIRTDPLPFLLAARAQGELASSASRGRAWFAEGLCSSYEAFHHTKELRGADARDLDDEGEERWVSRGAVQKGGTLVPLAWYEQQVERVVPGRDAGTLECFRHPKIQPVVRRAVDLWLHGEKVLLFCFYRETARALRQHLGREVERATVRLAAQKLGLDPRRGEGKARKWLERVSRRLRRDDSPFHLALLAALQRPFSESRFRGLADRRDELVGHLLAYVCAPTFVARYLPFDDPAVRRALRDGESRREVIAAGVSALTHALEASADASGTTMMQRVRGFLEFARELADRARRLAPEGEEVQNPLTEYLDAVDAYVSPRRRTDDDDADARRTGTYRALATVRLVYGETARDVRERLMLAFNSPLFPEILVSSSVLAEGVDLHRFCRHVIHHDLCWNPSVLEQRTGRLDRIRCKAEASGNSIVVYQPFIAGSADEKMYRVVRDRERWFQIVMGQRFEFDEATSEKLAARVPLPDQLARELLFDLTRAVDLPESGSLVA